MVEKIFNLKNKEKGKKDRKKAFFFNRINLKYHNFMDGKKSSECKKVHLSMECQVKCEITRLKKKKKIIRNFSKQLMNIIGIEKNICVYTFFELE